MLARSGSLYADVTRRLRARLDLPAGDSGRPDDWPIYHGFSPAVVPRPADALRSCLDGPAYRTRAAELGRAIRAEDGAGAVLSLIG